MNLEELLARLEAIAELTNDELTEIETQLRQAYRDLRTGELNEDVIALLSRITEAVDSITAQSSTRAEAQAELDRQAAELDARLDAETEVAEDEPEATEEPADGEAQEPEVETEGPGSEEESSEEPVVEAVAASARPTPRPIAELARRTPIRTQPRATHSAARVTATPNVPNMRGGQEITERSELAQAMSEVWNANRGADGNGVKVPVARVSADFPEDRMLRSGDSAWTTWEKIQDALSPFRTQDAIVAAGGICAPTTPLYEQVVISHASRPVRDALPGFNADRGGINWIAPPSLSSIGTTGGSPSQAIDQITEAEDAASATKPHQFVDCGTPHEAQIYAVTNILEFGNLMQRTFPEEVAAYTDLSMAAHARYAENLLLTAIAAGSTAVTTQQDLGAARDVLNMVTLAAVAYRNRHRMPPDAPLRAMLPDWIVGMIQNDMWSALNVGQDPASVTRGDIVRWFSFRGVNVSFFEDGVGPGTPGYQIFPAQSAGALNAWPTVMQWYLFHEGAWLFLDGGTLDLGIVRDSTLNQSNKFQTFIETFEQVAFVGIESLKVLSTICANGGTAGTISPDSLCDGGS